MAGTRPELIEAAFLSDASALLDSDANPLFANGLNYEPELVPNLTDGAAVTMYMRLPKQVDAETGPGVDVEYSWLVNVYVPLQTYDVAAEQVKETVCGLLTITRRNPRLGETCEWAELSSAAEEPIYNDKEGWIMCQLSLRATLTET